LVEAFRRWRAAKFVESLEHMCDALGKVERAARSRRTWRVRLLSTAA
jgi:hypothetical protein